MTCPTCNQTIRKAEEQLPHAERLYINYMGRMLYKIDGHPGLWMMTNKDSEREGNIKATRGPGRSTGGCSLFWRAGEVEGVISGAMEDER